MDLVKELLKEHSKPQALKIAAWAQENEAHFKQFIAVFLSSNYRINQRAAWPLGFVAKNRIELVLPYVGELIDNLKKEDIHDAVKRNTIRFLQDVDVPEEYMGDLANICFGYLADPNEAVAIKVFSMSVLLNITKKYPDFKNELKLLIEEQLPHGSAGFRSRGNKVLKALEKIN
jgi:hypothetical protein